MQEQTSGLSTNCAACGGDPGGIVYEGFILAGLLSAEDIGTLFHHRIDDRTIVRLFRRGILRGFKAGKRWMTRPSWLLEDLDRAQRAGGFTLSRQLARSRAVVEVAR